ELFHIFNNMHEAGRQVILAADRPPNQLTNLNKGVRSRLEWGLATDVQVPDENTRLEILKKKESSQGLDIPDDLLVMVARSLKSNVRELEGFLKRMHAYVTLSHQTVSKELVQTVIQELNPDNAEDMPATAPPHRAPVKESPAPAKLAHDPTGISSEVSRILNGENGHKNGHAKPAEKKPEPPPAPKTDTLNEILKAIDSGAAASKAEAPASAKPPTAPVEKALEPPPAPKAPPPPPPAPNVPETAPVAKAPEPAPAAKPPAPAAAAAPEIPDIPIEAPLFDDAEVDPSTAGHKEVTAVFFYPEGSGDAFETVHKKFQDVIKKHKLKFRLKRVHSEAYACKGKINYSNFVSVCKDKSVPVAIVIGPPPDTLISEQDFYDLLTVALDVQGVSLQLVNWGEINKDYRYLNLALDIALVKSR
ncbi:MAG: hypothetical protein JO102_06800, partial [Elusimicrobia bacterium]|nr:hypothetical protein [Elusimicrobiota bacterium]